RSGRVYGARSSRFNGNAGCRRRRRAGYRSYSSTHARGSGAWSSGRNANMNLAGHLTVRWLGRTEFAHALALQEDRAANDREDASLEDQLLLLEHEPVYTIG